MSSKVSFKNIFEEYTPKITATVYSETKQMVFIHVTHIAKLLPVYIRDCIAQEHFDLIAKVISGGHCSSANPCIVSVKTNLKNTLKVSDGFKKTLEDFITTKMQLHKTMMDPEMCHDGTVYTGTSGLSLYYCLQCHGNDKEYLTLALQYLNLNGLKGRKISFLCGDAGPLAIATVISYKFGMERPSSLPEYNVLAQRLINLISLLNDSPDEILYGKAGYLYALLFVNKHTGKETIPASHIIKVIEAIIKSGKKFSAKIMAACPLIWEWHDKIYLGAAHGVAGILYMLLQARHYIDSLDMEESIRPTIDWLLNQQFPSGNFPSSMKSSSGDKLVQWCHGAPGFIPLCLLAYQVFEDKRYLNIAIKSGETVWNRGLCTKGYSLCHGVSGNAYGFIQLYQITKDPLHAYRACCFMKWCILENPNTEMQKPDRPASLFEGLLGRIYLAQDILDITHAKFPAFAI